MGLIPFWAKDADIGYRTINAKAESIDTKPAFREAFRQRRCLVPSDGFYEWKKVGSIKQPYLLTMADWQPVRLRRPVGAVARPRER